MISKHIGNLAAESLKFFFNIDHCVTHHWLVTALLLVSIFRLFLIKLLHIFQDGIQTVKDDIIEIRSQVAVIKERLDKNEVLGTLVKRANQFIFPNQGSC